MYLLFVICYLLFVICFCSTIFYSWLFDSDAFIFTKNPFSGAKIDEIIMDVVIRLL